MDNDNSCADEFSRRRWLKLGLTSAIATFAVGANTGGAIRPAVLRTSYSTEPRTSNGGACPYPIPWLDKNGNLSQAAMPNVELSSGLSLQRDACPLQLFPRRF